MRKLREDIAYVYRSWREWVHTEDKKPLLRQLRWMKTILVGGTALGTYALLTADDVVEVVLGAGILVGPAVVVGFYIWFAWNALRAARSERKEGLRPP